MDTYKYFSVVADRRLFVCSETGEEGISHEFVLSLDELREACGFPFNINSGYRSPRHSKEVVKNTPGEHTRGAADVKCLSSYKRFIIVKYALAMGFTGIGIAKTFIHLDKRIGTPRIWLYKD